MVRLIDADELMKTLMHEGLGYQYNRVANAPTVDAVPVRHGKWIPWKYHNGFRCEFCNEPVDNKHNYCPNCGAKMDGERNEQ